jgi:hypothetical protein
VCLLARGSRCAGAEWAVAVFYLEIVCDCGWSQDGGARRRSQCGPRVVERGREMCNFVQAGRGCVVLSRSSKLSLCRKELEAGGEGRSVQLPDWPPTTLTFPIAPSS